MYTFNTFQRHPTIGAYRPCCVAADAPIVNIMKVIGSDGVAHLIITKSDASKNQWISAIANNIAALIETATKPK